MSILSLHNNNNNNNKSIILSISSFIAGSVITSCCFIIFRNNKNKNNNNNNNNTLLRQKCGKSNNNNEDNDDNDDTNILLQNNNNKLNNNDNDNNNLQQKCIYLDYNGTTPIYNDIYNVMIPYLTKQFGNPSSNHYYGIQPRNAIDNARKQILNMLGYNNVINNDNKELLQSIIFTGCGTESNNLSMSLAIQYFYIKKNNNNIDNNKKLLLLPHIVTSNVEHPAIIACLKMYQNEKKCEVTFVPVQTNGRVLDIDIINAIRPEQTILVTLMLANNESGAIQPVKVVSEYCNENNILIHIDAAQAVGKISMNLIDIGYPDMITIVGHKIGAPKGVACLYIKPECFNNKNINNNKNIQQSSNISSSQLNGQLLGGGQEFGWRAGTENVSSIVGLGKACELCSFYWIENNIKMEKLRSILLLQLESLLGKDILRINGPIEKNLRLPNTLSIGIKGIQSNQLLESINNQLAASAGAACHSSSKSNGISNVLQAMQVPEDYARGTIRLSVGPLTTEDEIYKAAIILSNAAKDQLRLQQ